MTNGYRPFWEPDGIEDHRDGALDHAVRHFDDSDSDAAFDFSGDGAPNTWRVTLEKWVEYENGHNDMGPAPAPDLGHRPAFDGAVERTLHDALDVCRDRGDQYGDTWSLDCQITTFTDHVLRAVLGHDSLSPEAKRLLKCAALIDIKDERMMGPWKADSVDDGINYRAAFRQWMAAYEAGLA